MIVCESDIFVEQKITVNKTMPQKCEIDALGS